MSNPTLLPHAFAEAALPANITNPVPDAPTGSNAASWQQGFPPITMTPKASGGQPPQGADVNGVLNAMSAHTVFLQEGGVYEWDSTVGAVGYAKGATIQLNDGVTLVTSTVAANTTNPNSSMTGWQYLNANAQPNLAAPLVGGVANAYTLATTPAGAPALPTLPQIITFSVPTAKANTGAATIAINGNAAVPLTYQNGAALTGGELTGSTNHIAIAVNLGTSYAILDLVNPATHGAASSYVNATGVAISSGSDVMCGFGFQFTPVTSGKVLIVAVVGVTNNGTTSACTNTVNYGTGTPPALNAATTGTRLSTRNSGTLAASASASNTYTAVVSGLTLGVPVWLDCAGSTGGGNMQVNQVNFSVVEL